MLSRKCMTLADAQAAASERIDKTCSGHNIVVTMNGG